MRVLPWTCSPEIVGAALFTGAGGRTTTVTGELAGLLFPPLLIAVSRTEVLCADVRGAQQVGLFGRAGDFSACPAGLSQRSHLYS